MAPRGLIPIADAALILASSPGKVHRLICTQALRGGRRGDRWFADAKSVERLRKQGVRSVVDVRAGATSSAA